MPHHAKFSLQCMWLVALPNPSKAVVVLFSRYLQYHGLHIQWESCSSRDVHQLGFNGHIMKHQHHLHPQKPSKLRKTPVIPCLNCLRASNVRVRTFGIPDFIISMFLCKTHGETNFELNPRTRRFSRWGASWLLKITYIEMCNGSILRNGISEKQWKTVTLDNLTTNLQPGNKMIRPVSGKNMVQRPLEPGICRS